jgi:hypothetical protein
MNITKSQSKIENRTSITELPNDILNKLVYHTTESIEDKIDKESSIMKLRDIKRYIDNHADKLKAKLGEEIIEACVYYLVFRKCNEKHEGTYLINTANLSTKTDIINICRVVPDTDKRIFGRFRIVETSIMLHSGLLYDYKLIYKPPPVNYNVPVLLCCDPSRVDNTPYNYNTNIKIIYNTELMNIKNQFCLVEVVSVLKNTIRVKAQGSAEVKTISKRYFYNTE